MPTATKSKTKFTADQFVASHGDTAEAKAKFANHMVRFILGGFKQTLFPKWFYTRLSMSFGHIAHTNIHGFYATWFCDTKSKREFIENIREWPCYGQPEYTYSDVERALRSWVSGDGQEAIAKVLNSSDEVEAKDMLKEQKRIESVQDKTSLRYIVVRASTNTGSFGHRRYIVVGEDATAYSIDIVPSNLNLELDQVLDVPVKNTRLDWSKFYVECPTRLADVPEEALKELNWPE